MAIEASLACNLAAISDRERPLHLARGQELFTAWLRERQELDHGYAFRFEASAYELVTEFVARERLCCPFFQFTIELAAANGPIWLRITGVPGAKGVLEAGLREMNLLEAL